MPLLSHPELDLEHLIFLIGEIHAERNIKKETPLDQGQLENFMNELRNDPVMLANFRHDYEVDLELMTRGGRQRRSGRSKKQFRGTDDDGNTINSETEESIAEPGISHSSRARMEDEDDLFDPEPVDQSGASTTPSTAPSSVRLEDKEVEENQSVRKFFSDTSLFPGQPRQGETKARSLAQRSFSETDLAAFEAPADIAASSDRSLLRLRPASNRSLVVVRSVSKSSSSSGGSEDDDVTSRRERSPSRGARTAPSASLFVPSSATVVSSTLLSDGSEGLEVVSTTSFSSQSSGAHWTAMAAEGEADEQPGTSGVSGAASSSSRPVGSGGGRSSSGDSDSDAPSSCKKRKSSNDAPSSPKSE